MKKTVYEDGLVKISILTPEETQEYKDMPVGISQTMDYIRYVTVNGNEKRIFEITAYGFSETKVKMNDNKEDI